ncbi:MAG: helix-turn-helix domain-containing protein [Thalassotalea sp.]
MKEVLFNGYDMVLVLSIYQCLLFAVFLVLSIKEKKLSNQLLAIFLLSYAAIPLDNLINFGESFRAYAITSMPDVFYIFGIAYWIEAPILLLYVQSLIYRDFTFKKHHYCLFIPALLYTLYLFDGWFLLPTEVKVAALESYAIEEDNLTARFISLFRECFRFMCGVLCILELRRYQKKIRDVFSNIEDKEFTWLKILVIGFVFIYADAITVHLSIILSFELNVGIDHEFFGLASNFINLFLISYLIFYNLKYSSVFTGIETDHDTIINKGNDEQTFSDEVIAKIECYMNEQKPYLNHLLNIENLASQLTLSPRKLSTIINRYYQKNFFEFINRYRVEEAKNLLIEDQHKSTTMINIMDMAGFNSKATFNVIFKKIVGVTPTQFRKNAR